MKRDNLLFIALIIGILFPSLLKAQRAGLDWGLVNLGKEVDIRSITGFGEDTLIACGASATIVKSVDGGQIWKSKISDNDNETYFNLKFVNSQIGYMLSFKKLLKTTDSGETWKTIYSFTDYVENLFIIDQDTMYIMSCFRNKEKADKVLKSIDGGSSWNVSFEYTGPIGYYGYWLNNMFFIGNTGYIVTSEIPEETISDCKYEYTIYKSIDYGKTWNPVNKFENTFACLYYGYFERPSELFFNSISSGRFYSESKTFSTEDGFETFEIEEQSFMNNDENNITTSAYFQTNGKHCITYCLRTIQIREYDAFMKYSNDNGKTWIVGKGETFNSENPSFYRTTYRTGDSVFYLGINKGILRSPAFPSSIDKVNTADFNLYPNPVTSEFTITSNNLYIVKTEIFDLLGNLILSKTGTENLNSQIDCSHLGSGVYIVKITTSQGICTKKISKL